MRNTDAHTHTHTRISIDLNLRFISSNQGFGMLFWCKMRLPLWQQTWGSWAGQNGSWTHSHPDCCLTPSHATSLACSSTPLLVSSFLVALPPEQRLRLCRCAFALYCPNSDAFCLLLLDCRHVDGWVCCGVVLKTMLRLRTTNHKLHDNHKFHKKIQSPQQLMEDIHWCRPSILEHWKFAIMPPNLKMSTPCTQIKLLLIIENNILHKVKLWLLNLVRYWKWHEVWGLAGASWPQPSQAKLSVLGWNLQSFHMEWKHSLYKLVLTHFQTYKGDLKV